MNSTEVRPSALDAARDLAPEISTRAPEGEAARTMPPALVERMRSAGLFGLGRPRLLGGMELDPVGQMEVIEELSRADGSTGWTVMIGNSSTSLAWLDPAVARDLIGTDADGAASGVLAPMGRAVPDGDGYAVDGRWPFTSGCRHATWTLTGVLVMDGAGPRQVSGRGPDWRLAVLPASDVEIHDTWHSLGLRGSGSHDVSVHRRVPAAHLADPFHDLAPHDGPLWRIPFFTQLAFGHTGFALGVARRALDEFTRLAATKRRGPAPNPVAESGDAQLALARAEGGLQAARAFAVDAFGSLWDSAGRGDVPGLPVRARVLLAALNAERAAVSAVDAVFPYAGASGVYSSEPLQRCFRDLHTAGQHIYVGADAWKRCAKLSLGIDGPTYQI